MSEDSKSTLVADTTTEDRREYLVSHAVVFLLLIVVGAALTVPWFGFVFGGLIPSWVIPIVLLFALLVPAPFEVHRRLCIVAAASIPVATVVYALVIGYAGSPGWMVAGAALASTLFVCAACGVALHVSKRRRKELQRHERAKVELAEAAEVLDRFGCYTLERKLSQGGMGEVWIGQHVFLKRPAAIKVIRREMLENQIAENDAQQIGGASSIDDILARFEREASAIAMLTSPNTVQIYDYGRTSSGTFYYAMELLHGIDLQRYVRTYGPMPQERAIYLLEQACYSLAEAHEAGFAHRDIKPQNIFLTKRGIQFDVIKVLDFGLVLDFLGANDPSAVHLTAANAVCGTPSFMAPEQARGRQVDHRADIYSLGCVAYYLLTGTHVFKANDPIERILAHVQEPPEPLAWRAPRLNIHPDLDRLVLRCLEKDPNRRVQSALQLASAMSALSLPRRWTRVDSEQWALQHPSVYAGHRVNRISAMTPPLLRPVASVFSHGANRVGATHT